ncbi:hypothetical protein [Archangium sp.]|uniref:hypothetical protein n=1 Tax=Archangium sp. TaxID=1872627 RepID=UPI002D3182C0|nr:hypothetical protein [Archangium sp.]HYO51743.1 hypothetical protein [Archangium sp.]
MRLIVLVTVMAMASARCAHAQRPEPQIHIISEDAEGVGTALGSGGAGGHDCQKEHEECMEICWKKRYPWPHNKRQAGWYYKRCTSDCKDQYNECMKEQEEAAKERGKKLEFSRMAQAIEWIRVHKAEVALGTIVIVGGVAFILATGGSGALILAPLAL